MSSKQFGRLMPLLAALMLGLSVAGCASGPLGSHGVDYIPAFETGRRVAANGNPT
ncbi:MAG TPA: hypothetical protein VHY82_11915 [Acetobacteraceae bacterium]|nr:hypothetical protein [Acetobacteraceae bacterium]